MPLFSLLCSVLLYQRYSTLTAAMCTSYHDLAACFAGLLALSAALPEADANHAAAGSECYDFVGSAKEHER